MKITTWIAVLMLALTALFVISCEKEEEVDELVVTPEEVTAEIGQWVEYNLADEAMFYLALTDQTPEGYWIEAAIAAEGENIIIRALVSRDAFDDALGDVWDWYRNPEAETDGFIGYQDLSFDAAEMDEELEEFLEMLEGGLLQLHVQINEFEAYDVKVGEVIGLIREMKPELLALAESFADLGEAFIEEAADDEEPFEVSFETLPGGTIIVAGESLTTNMIKIIADDSVSELYYTPAVPFFGLVKLVSEEEEAITLVGFGVEGARSRFTVADLQPLGREELEEMLLGLMMLGEMMGGFATGMEGMDFGDFGGMYDEEFDMAELEAMIGELEGMMPPGY